MCFASFFRFTPHALTGLLLGVNGWVQRTAGCASPRREWLREFLALGFCVRPQAWTAYDRRSTAFSRGCSQVDLLFHHETDRSLCFFPMETTPWKLASIHDLDVWESSLRGDLRHVENIDHHGIEPALRIPLTTRHPLCLVRLPSWSPPSSRVARASSTFGPAFLLNTWEMSWKLADEPKSLAGESSGC